MLLESATKEVHKLKRLIPAAVGVAWAFFATASHSQSQSIGAKRIATMDCDQVNLGLDEDYRQLRNYQTKLSELQIQMDRLQNPTPEVIDANIAEARRNIQRERAAVIVLMRQEGDYRADRYNDEDLGGEADVLISGPNHAVVASFLFWLRAFDYWNGINEGRILGAKPPWSQRDAYYLDRIGQIQRDLDERRRLSAEANREISQLQERIQQLHCDTYYNPSVTTQTQPSRSSATGSNGDTAAPPALSPGQTVNVAGSWNGPNGQIWVLTQSGSSVRGSIDIRALGTVFHTDMNCTLEGLDLICNETTSRPGAAPETGSSAGAITKVQNGQATEITWGTTGTWTRQ
jgi:hypothetical protein